MAASKQTSWLFRHFHLLYHLVRIFWGLNESSGLFPSWQWSLSPIVSLLNWIDWSILSLWQISTTLAARIETVLYPFKNHNPTLRLNAFRGEPASSKFDWHFTAIFRSSDDFSTSYGSDFHQVLPWLHPAQR